MCHVLKKAKRRSPVLCRLLLLYSIPPGSAIMLPPVSLIEILSIHVRRLVLKKSVVHLVHELVSYASVRIFKGGQAQSSL